MTGRLQDKVMLITGAGSGLGREVALLAAAGRAGGRPVLHSRTSIPFPRDSPNYERLGGTGV